MCNLERITHNNLSIYQSQILEVERLSFPSPWSPDAFEAEVQKSISHLWAVTANEHLWGYLCFWMFPNEIQLVNIAIHPHKRGKGYAQTLLAKMFEISHSKGINHIWLEVRPSNQAAKNLYTKFGFYEVSRRPKYYMDNQEDAIIMALELQAIKNNRLHLRFHFKS